MVGVSNRLVTIVVIATAVFMSNLDLWIVNVALVGIGADLHVSLSSASWVLNAYAVTLAALLIPAGRLGDRNGHRQVFLAGVVVFTLASVACALAPNITVLVVARIVQAAGAAAQLPTSLALLMAAVDPSKRLAAARGWSAVGAMAAVLGPVAGGLLVEISWRWVFLVNLPIGVAALAFGVRTLPRLAAHQREPLPDLVASALLIVGVGGLTGGLVEAPSWGWAAPGTLALFAAAVLALGLFVQRCRTHERPMVELPLLRVRAFAAANGATFLFGAAFAIMLLSNSLWCQDVWGYSALRTGLALMPGPAMVPPTTYLSMRFVHRYGSGPVAAVGGVLFALSQLWRIAYADATPAYALDLLPSMLVSGVGVGLALGTLIAAAATALPAHRAATASAIVNSGRQVASALGVAVLVTVVSAAADPIDGFRWAWGIGAALAVLTTLASLTLPRPAASRPASRPGSEPAPAAAADVR